MEEQPQGGSTFPEMLKAAKKLTAAAETVTQNSESIGLVANGIGRYLLNEDGTVRDFTNVKLMEETARKVDDGMATMNAIATSIDDRIKHFPTTIEHSFTNEAFARIRRLNNDLIRERIMFIGAAVIVALFAAFTAYKAFGVADRSKELQKWYEENHEAILFGRYLRVHENNRWNY